MLRFLAFNALTIPSLNDWKSEAGCNSVKGFQTSTRRVCTSSVRDYWPSTRRTNKQVKFFDRRRSIAGSSSPYLLFLPLHSFAKV